MAFRTTFKSLFFEMDKPILMKHGTYTTHTYGRSENLIKNFFKKSFEGNGRTIFSFYGKWKLTLSPSLHPSSQCIRFYNKDLIIL